MQFQDCIHLLWSLDLDIVMQIPVLPVVGKSVRPPVCLSRARIVSKRDKIGSQNLHRRIARGLCSCFKSFFLKVRLEIRKGSPRARVLHENGVGKIGVFRPNKVAVSQKWCKAWPRLLLLTNMKSHTRFWLVSKSTTLDYLERPLRTAIVFVCVCVCLLVFLPCLANKRTHYTPTDGQTDELR